MTYREAVEYIEEIPKFTKKHTLEHTREFLRRLGDPEQGRQVIHVAGTNGKGSVCAYMQAMLEAEGKRAGFFTSPHLVTLNERIQIQRRPIGDDEFLDTFEKVKAVVEEMEQEGIAHPSYFEFLFGMGMTAFASHSLDYIILETGLGGRLDATNAIRRPALTVITSISLDHTQYLGDTIAQIAGEKAGIIKEGRPVVFDGSSQEASAVIRRRAKQLHAPCREITNHAYEIREITDKHLAFSRVNAYDDTIVWKLPNCGSYQAMNASLAIAGMEQCVGQPVTKEQFKRWSEALAKVTWEGRMEEVCTGVYLEGAHNPGAIDAFCDSYDALKEKDQELPVVLFAAAADKEYERMIETLCRRVPAKAYVLTEIEDERKLPAGMLAKVFERCTHRPVIVKERLEEAWEEALAWKGRKGKMYCLGSLYLMGMIKEYLERIGETKTSKE